MDFLCGRYGGSPFFVLDRYIEQQRFNEYIYEVWDIHNEEELYELWLHKVEGKSYQEFKDMVTPFKPINERDVALTIEESIGILNGFTLEEG